MLKTLSIQNYALIQQLQMDFESGFSTLTGETGAGKSILLGALSLILGNRADSAVISDPDKKCIVEASFEISSYKLNPFFEEHELDYDPITLIRREINNNGKSRAFINDTPVNLNLLKELSTQLIDIHSQHENLALSNNLFQLNVLDAVAKNKKVREEYQTKYKEYQQAQKKLKSLSEMLEQADAERDYNTFQFNQLQELNIDTLDTASMEAELKKLDNAELIQQNLNNAYQILNGQEISINAQLIQSRQFLEQIKTVYPQAKQAIERIESARIDLNDIASEAENDAETTVYDPERNAYLKEILDKVFSLMQKHKVESTKELITVKDNFENLLLKDQSYTEDIEKLQTTIHALKEALTKLAKNITESRIKVIKPLSSFIQKQLIDLGMKNALLAIDIITGDEFTINGQDQVNFLFSANKSHAPQNISKIASGGEISRLMLSIKCLLSKSIALPSIIFDEIDTGVSGEIADKMADIMNQMAENMQVISITHLPQIAAKGKTHYKVYKSEMKDKTITQIDKLDINQRVDELARMLSGKDVTNQAIENAKSLLSL